MAEMRLPLLASLLAATSACATYKVTDYSTERQWRGSSLPPSRLDVDASEIGVMGFSSWVKDEKELRNEIAHALGTMLPSPPGAPAGRFRVRASLQSDKYYFAFF